MFYAGLDLGSKGTRVHVRDAAGNAVYSGWAQDLAELKKTLGRWGPELSVTFESTTGAFFLVDELRDLVKGVKVAHPRDLRAIGRVRIKNGRLDAEKLRVEPICGLREIMPRISSSTTTSSRPALFEDPPQSAFDRSTE